MLIILTKSPWTEGRSSILKIAEKTVKKGEKVAVLHIQDACIATIIDEYCDQLEKNKIKMYALKADCEARGLTGKVDQKVKIIDYKQWVNLVMNKHDKIVSWTS